MGNAYLARRESPEGSSPVVVKVIRASIGGGEVAPGLVAMKEAVALGRLNESVPSTPFVVRFVDAGNAVIAEQPSSPWTAIEYVHGGVEGTTLEDRVTYSLHKTGYAFDAARAAHAIRCLCAGLSAIHGVGVIHRDLSPGNVLCCGFGETEIFKISDFGVARATGLKLTFEGLNLGTLGYSAPESSSSTAGPHSDVFSFATVVYYLLTGQHYFDAPTPMVAMRLFMSESRPSITSHPSLCPELLERPHACSAIDAALARATSLSVAQRPTTAEQFAALMLPWFGEQSSGPHSSRLLLSALRSSRPSTLHTAYHWIVRSRPRDDIVVRSTAWDTDGHAFALTANGACFWNGTAWIDASRVLAGLPGGMTFTQRYEAGGWLVGGNNARLSVIDTRGISDAVEAPDADICFSLASGRMADLLVAVETRSEQAPVLHALSARRWMKPVFLNGVAYVSTLQRLDDARWLLGGRMLGGGGFAAVYSPMQLDVVALATPSLRSFIGGASAADRSVALLVGSDGIAVRVDGDRLDSSSVPGTPDLAAAAVDVLDREWATSLGVLWSRDFRQGGPWHPMWSDPTWKAPFVSLMADAGIVLAMTADGGIVEGRVE